MKLDIGRVLPTGTSEAEPARAFLQNRIGLWAFWVFALSFGFYLMNILTWPFVQRSSPDFLGMMLQTGNLDHLAASLVFGGTWVLTQRVTMTTQTLKWVELGALWLGCGLFALMAAAMSQTQMAVGLDTTVGTYAGLLACANTVMARAIVVPSTTRRTLVASSAAMAPLIPAALVATGTSGALVVNIATWCMVSIAIASVGSDVIFGLRTEAARVRRLGQYLLEARIGSGGMGVVYRASHAMLRRPTAIKLLPADRAGEASLARFEREVQLTAQLSHPNTVAIYDYGRTPDGVFYYAMEYLDGVNLEDLVATDGPQPAGRVVSILEQVCGALAEAHEHGLVHRDIKPANIILTERGGEPDVAKVVDFGLVKPLVSATPDVTQTASAVLVGTPLYMAPDAMTMPESPDPRSDLYALGAVGYFLVTGHPVFEGASIAEVIGHHLHTNPTPPSQRLGRPVPHDLETLLLQCLEKRADERPQSARALREALRQADVEPWTVEDALEWWRRFRAQPRPAASTRPETATGDVTVAVDVDDRLAQTR